MKFICITLELKYKVREAQLQV